FCLSMIFSENRYPLFRIMLDKQKGSGTPAGAFGSCTIRATPARVTTRLRFGRGSPVGVPPRLSPGGFRPFRSAPGQASWDVARAHRLIKLAPTGGRKTP